MEQIRQLRVQQLRRRVYSEQKTRTVPEEEIIERSVSAFLPSLRFRLYSQYRNIGCSSVRRFVNSSRFEEEPIWLKDSKIFFARRKCSNATFYL